MTVQTPHTPPPIPQVTSTYITTGAAAMRIGKNRQTILRWIDSGQLPAHIFRRPVPGGHFLIDVLAFDEWVKNSCYAQIPDETDAA